MNKNYETLQETEIEENQIPQARTNERISHLKELYDEYSLNPTAFLNKMNEDLREEQAPIIHRIEFHFNNEDYEMLSNHLKRKYKDLFFIEIKEELMHSIVQNDDIGILKIHNSTTIIAGDGSHLRFGPHKHSLTLEQQQEKESYLSIY